MHVGSSSLPAHSGPCSATGAQLHTRVRCTENDCTQLAQWLQSATMSTWLRLVLQLCFRAPSVLVCAACATCAACVSPLTPAHTLPRIYIISFICTMYPCTLPALHACSQAQARRRLFGTPAHEGGPGAHAGGHGRIQGVCVCARACLGLMGLMGLMGLISLMG